MEVLKEFGATVIHKNDRLNFYRLKIPQDVTVSEFVEQKGQNKIFEIAEPNFIVSALSAEPLPPNDPSFSSEWAIAKIGVIL